MVLCALYPNFVVAHVLSSLCPPIICVVCSIFPYSFFVMASFCFRSFFQTRFVAKRCVLEENGRNFAPPIHHPTNRSFSTIYLRFEAVHAKQKHLPYKYVENSTDSRVVISCFWARLLLTQFTRRSIINGWVQKGGEGYTYSSWFETAAQTSPWSAAAVAGGIWCYRWGRDLWCNTLPITETGNFNIFDSGDQTIWRRHLNSSNLGCWTWETHFRTDENFLYLLPFSVKAGKTVSKSPPFLALAQKSFLTKLT